MKSQFAQLVLLLLGLNFLLVGATGLADPVKLMDPVQLEIAGVSGLSEIRAAYGGTHLALGLLFIAGLVSSRWRRTALLVAALFTGGLVVGRVISLGIDGPPGPFVRRLFFLETLGAVTALLALRFQSSDTSPF